jgi:hypothetical protein
MKHNYLPFKTFCILGSEGSSYFTTHSKDILRKTSQTASSVTAQDLRNSSNVATIIELISWIFFFLKQLNPNLILPKQFLNKC